MATSIWEAEVQAVLDGAKQQTTRSMMLDNRVLEVPPPFPSPEDWRDQWIYFLMVDRFNNPTAPPRHLPYDGSFGVFQGGTFNGVREQLPYLKELGVGALWLSPVLKNCQFQDGTYHGYGIQDFLHVEPRFASDPSVTEQELRMLIDSAHAHDIYVVFDIVLNHTGDVFAYQCRPDDAVCQGTGGAEASFSETIYSVAWRDEHGTPRLDWPVAEAIPNPPADGTVWPTELRRNASFRRQGIAQAGGDEVIGDFASLKQLLTGDPNVQKVLIRAYQYLIAKFDIDGFRIDTLKYLNREFARIFGNAMREFALSIGKKNFFTFGEVYDDEQKIARFIGRSATDPGDLIGVDAALDYPLFFTLLQVAKGLQPPNAVVQMYQRRKQAELGILSSHGEATNFFVTFLDNHDQPRRFYFSPAEAPHRYDDQVTLGLGCLFALQGIPCLYYGTEQGLHGDGSGQPNEADWAVREALWGKENPFDRASPFYERIKALALVRGLQPALRYGRQYFRSVSGNRRDFGISPFPTGVLAFSRILNDEEVVVVANTDNQPNPVSLAVLVDYDLNVAGQAYHVLYSNKPHFTAPGEVEESGQGQGITIDGEPISGTIKFVPVTLQPMEVQILGQEV